MKILHIFAGFTNLPTDRELILFFGTAIVSCIVATIAFYYLFKVTMPSLKKHRFVRVAASIPCGLAVGFFVVTI